MGLPFRAEPLDFWLGASKKMEKKISLPGSLRKKKLPCLGQSEKKNPCPSPSEKKKSLPMGKTSLSERWKEKKKIPAHWLKKKKIPCPCIPRKKKFPALECQVKKISAWLQFSTPPTKNLMVRPLFCFRLKWAHWARWSLGTIWPRLFGQLFS